MQTRDGGRLDYAELHKTGKRVFKDEPIMNDQEKVEELKCRGDLEYTLLVYKIDDLESEEDGETRQWTR